MVNTMTLKDFRKTKEPYFRLVNKKGEVSKTTYFVNGYERSEKKYSISPFEDINKEKFVKSTQLVTIDFEF
jgi:hypothetical protein